MARNVMSEDEKRWRAEDDARTLRRAQEIMQDKARVSMAKGCIQKEMNAVMAVAKTVGVVKSSPAKKATTTKKTTKKK